MSKTDPPHADLAATLREAADFIETLPADVGRPSVSASALDDGSPFVTLDLRDVDEDAFRRIVDLLPGQEWTDLGRSAYACRPGLPAPICFVNAHAVKQKPAPATVDFEAIARDIAEADQ